MLVSVRIAKTKSISGQMGHDFNNRPAYADGDKSDLNRTIVGGSIDQITATIDRQKKQIVNSHNSMQEAKRDLLKSTIIDKKTLSKSLNGVRNLRSDAPTHKTMIVTFCNDFYLQQDHIDRDKLDRCMIQFTDDFCKKNHCEISYIVRHEDETTPHYHVTLTNYNTEKCTTHKFNKSDLCVVQDMAGERFSPMGIKRGVKKSERIAEAEKLNARDPGESEEDYKYRIKKIANVIHRSVAELHRDLPNELSELHLQVENAQIAIRKTQTNLDRTRSELANADLLSVEKIAKLEKREQVYLSRLGKHEQRENELIDQLDELEQKNTSLQSELQCNSEKIDTIKRVVSERLIEGNKKIDSLKIEIEKLAKQPAPADYTEEFEIKTGTFKTEIMQLVRPVKYQQLMAKFNADTKNLSMREKRSNAHDKRLKREQADLISDRKKLDFRENNLGSEIENSANQLVRNAGDRVFENLSEYTLGLLNHGIKTHTLVTSNIALNEEQMRFYTSEMGQTLEQNMQPEINRKIPKTVRDEMDRSGWGPSR